MLHTRNRRVTTLLRAMLFCLASVTSILAAAEDARAQVTAQPAARWWKGNLHTHSLRSDGNYFPELIAEWYKEHDYNFLAFTDHNRLLDGETWVDPQKGRSGVKEGAKKYRKRFDTQWIDEREVDGKSQIRVKALSQFRHLYEEPQRFLLLEGEELSPYLVDEQGKRVAAAHVNAINHRRRIGPAGRTLASVSEILQACVDAVADQRKQFNQPMITIINHPPAAEDVAAVKGARYCEIYNGHPSVQNYDDEKGFPGFERKWDIALALRLAGGEPEPLYGIAADDAHQHHWFKVGRSNPGRGWIMVRTPDLTEDSIIAAMEAGDFYASTGVYLDDVSFDGKRLRLKIRAEKGVTYKTRFIGTCRGFDQTSSPRTNSTGGPLPYATRVYSRDIGKVLAEVEGASPAYALKGDEVYVRGKVISSKLKENPHTEGDREMAWTQPVVPSH